MINEFIRRSDVFLRFVGLEADDVLSNLDVNKPSGLNEVNGHHAYMIALVSINNEEVFNIWRELPRTSS